MRDWGKSLKHFHDTASGMSKRYRYEALQSFSIDKLAEAVRAPDHALHKTPEVVDDLSEALHEASQDVDRATASQPERFLHGDVHRSNCAGNPVVLFDLDYSGWGPLPHDFSTIALGVHRYGWPGKYLDEFKRAYGSEAPTHSEIAPFLRLRELVTCGWVMQFAIPRAPENLQELPGRLRAIKDPSHTADPWIHAGDFAMMDSSRLRI